MIRAKLLHVYITDISKNTFINHKIVKKEVYTSINLVRSTYKSQKQLDRLHLWNEPCTCILEFVVINFSLYNKGDEAHLLF